MKPIQSFLKKHWKASEKLILGYSGGGDSKALLYALLECGVKPELAHVDHGWRPESRLEAEQLREEAAGLGLVFHVIRLEKIQGEDAARKERLKFFKTLLPYRALLLAHHGDDLAETTLKRVFEGAHLSFLGGMDLISEIEGIEVWRPLLYTRRQKIRSFLEEKNLSPLEDPTNRDPAYLRSRMRTDLFPYLNQTFGKEVAGNLICLSKRAAELKAYLDKKIENVPILRGPWGRSADLEGLERIEKRHLIQHLSREVGVTISRTLLENILDWIELKIPNRKVLVQQREIRVDRGTIIISN